MNRAESPRRSLRSRRRWRAAALAAAVLLAGCGGGGGDGGLPPPTGSCTLLDQQTFLRGYFDDWYFWYAISPSPSPSGYDSLGGYFDALLYTGTDPDFPADRWSNFQSSESFDRFFGDGQTLGYGMRVAALEVTGQPDEPLYVRYIDPGSPAAAAGLVRGDEVLALNGRSAASLIAGDDFSLLSPLSSAESLTVEVTGTSGHRIVTLPATIYAVVPVPTSGLTSTTISDRPMGYVVVNDMITQADAPLAAAFSQFKSAGVSEVVLDLRYNGGGLVSVGNEVASYVAGNRASGEVFASLLYNDKRAAANDQTFRFGNYASALGLARVYVLAGQRTCSASEQVINGLRPFVDVVTIGDTTCGKPVGFLPAAYCGTTYSVVNFETANADNEGRYFDGFNATCPVAEDYSQPLGGSGDPLLFAARSHADTGACPTFAAGATKRALGARATERPHRMNEPGERPAMIPR